MNEAEIKQMIDYLKHHIPIIIKCESGGWVNAHIFFENGTLIVKPDYNILFEN